jgi:hypothetical protein
MGFFSRSKGGSDRDVCPHDYVDPRWQNMNDVGRTDRIDHFVCRRCAVKIAPERVPQSAAEP